MTIWNDVLTYLVCSDGYIINVLIWNSSTFNADNSHSLDSYFNTVWTNERSVGSQTNVINWTLIYPWSTRMSNYEGLEYYNELVLNNTKLLPAWSILNKYMCDLHNMAFLWENQSKGQQLRIFSPVVNVPRKSVKNWSRYWSGCADSIKMFIE